MWAASPGYQPPPSPPQQHYGSTQRGFRSGLQRRLRLVRRLSRRRLRRGATILGVILVFWVLLGLGLFAYSWRHSDKQEIEVEKAALAAEVDMPAEPVTITAPPTHPPALKSRPTSSRQSRIVAEVPEPSELFKGLPEDGPILLHHTIRLEKLESASSRHMHGRIGRFANGTSSWQPAAAPDVKDMASELKSHTGFNVRLSDALPLDRPVHDLRTPACKTLIYDLTRLPETSVVLPFHNEALSLILRSLHSILNNTPPSLLKEIILVDDGSTNPELVASHSTTAGAFTEQDRGTLDYHLQLLPAKVKLLRRSRRGGAAAARQAGIRAAQADTFVVVDAHVEMQPKWLEPLLARIAERKSRLVAPIIDSLSPVDFEPTGTHMGGAVGFDWKLDPYNFRRAADPVASAAADPATGKSVTSTAYMESPVLPGNVFASDKNFFLQMGGYDTGMKETGAEHMELSFRYWQCGGSIEVSPCSHVYHVWRYGTPSGGGDDAVRDNKLRTASVWMDMFSHLVWQENGRPQNMQVGDLSKLREIRSHCHSFSWYLANVWPESEVQQLPRDVPYLGRLRNRGTGKCLSLPDGPTGAVRTHFCDDVNDNPLSNVAAVPAAETKGLSVKYFIKSGRITPVSDDRLCLDSSGYFRNCDFVTPILRWRYTTEGRLIPDTDKSSFAAWLSSRSSSEEEREDESEMSDLQVADGQASCLSASQTSDIVTLTQCKRLGEAGGVKGGGFRGAVGSSVDQASLQLWNWDPYTVALLSPNQA